MSERHIENKGKRNVSRVRDPMLPLKPPQIFYLWEGFFKKSLLSVDQSPE